MTGGLLCPTCGITGQVDRRILPELGTRTCGSCGLIMSVVDQVGRRISEFALVDRDAYMRSVGVTRRLQAEQILGWLTRYVGAGATLLDVGCSFGFFLSEARHEGFQVRGLEPDAQAHDHASALLGDGVVQRGVLEAGAVPPGWADVVSTLDVIEHVSIEHHEEFAGAVREALDPKGVWVIKVPTIEGLYYKLADALVRGSLPGGDALIRRMWQTRYEYPHLVYFSRRSLSLWLRRFGFSVLGYRYLSEVPSRTVIDRLTADGDIDRRKAHLVAPLLLGMNLVERVRGRSDALVVLARPLPGR